MNPAEWVFCVIGLLTCAVTLLGAGALTLGPAARRLRRCRAARWIRARAARKPDLSDEVIREAVSRWGRR